MLPDGSGAGHGGAGAEPAVEALEVPTFSLDELNRCRGQLLGKGAFGDVYSLRGFPRLAVKEMAIAAHEEKLAELVKRELEAIPKLSHPGVLKYHQVIEDGDFFYVVMDRYDRDLQRFITDHARTRRSIPRKSMLSIVRQLAEALAYVHAPYKVNERGDVLPGIVHRDIKPANVLMSRDGERVVLADFGVCKDVTHSGRTFAGSPAYMAPETLLSNKTSRASDIWSLGVIIYELAALKRPNFLEGKEPKDVFIDGWEPDLSTVEDDSVREILEKIFVLDPEKRPTAKDLCELLRVSDASVVGMRLRGMLLEEALNKANARIASLEEQYGSFGKAAGQPTGATEQSQVQEDSAAQQCSAASPRASWTPLMRAAFIGDIETAKQHLDEKNKKNGDGDTALMIAARAGHADVVELLDPTDCNGGTALMWAAGRGDVEVVRALIPLQKGRKTGSFCDNRTALMKAAACGHAEVVELLVEHEGAMQNNYGWTALMYAARNGYADCVKLLLKKEGGMQDKGGWTALMKAAQNGHTDCVKLLLEREGGMQDKDGWTALMFAAYWNNLECVRLLARKEKDMKTTRERNGFPPGTAALDIAKRWGHTAIASILSG